MMHKGWDARLCKELRRRLVADVSPFKPAGTWGQVSGGIVVVHMESFETTSKSSFVDF